MNFIIIIVFYSTLFLRPFLVISSSNIIIIWLSLELRVFSFLPIIISGSQTSFSAAKYFFVQRIGSIIILASSFYRFSNLTIRFFFIALILKLGMVPFHFWLPKLVASLQAKEMLILLVWQKVGPLFLIILIPSLQSYLKIFICILRVGVGRILGIKQTQWRQIFTFSSISHLGWIVIRRIVSFWLFTIYFLVYAISLVQIFIFRTSQFLNSSIYSFSTFNILNLFILLSLAGLPPILGFITKIIVLLYLLNSQFITLILFFLITFSIIRIFFYLKIFFTLTLSLNKFEINRGKRLILRNLIIFLSFPLILNFYKL